MIISVNSETLERLSAAARERAERVENIAAYAVEEAALAWRRDRGCPDLSGKGGAA